MESEKSYVCKWCGKKLKKSQLFFHAISELPLIPLRKMFLKTKKGEENMGMIIKDGKLVKEEDLKKEEPQEVIEELVNPVLEEKREKIIPRVEMQRTPYEQEKHDEDMVKFKEFLRQKKEEEERAILEQHEEELERQAEETERLEQHNNLQQMTVEEIERRKNLYTGRDNTIFYIVLRSAVKVSFSVPSNEADNFYNYILTTMTEKPILRIENKIIPVLSIDMVYFE
jgi:hypothetical protein